MSAYMTMPKEYVMELQNDGKREKARAFMEYCLDLDNGVANSISFYAKSWNLSKTGASKWIKNFKDAIEKHHQYWIEKNTQNFNKVHNNSIKSGVRLVYDECTEKISTSTIDTEFEKTQVYDECTTGVLSINNKQYNNKKSDQNEEISSCELDINFLRYFSELRLSTSKKYLGKKETAYQEYLKVKNIFEIDVIAYAYKKYFNPDDEKTVGLAKFIKEELYLSYLPEKISVKIQGSFVDGTFKDEVFEAVTGEKYKLNYARYLEKVANKELIFITDRRAI